MVEGGHLHESGADGINLRFTEGTEVSLTAGTRGRLRSVGKTGAKIAIEHGKAWFRVTPRRGADWSVEAGPFLVSAKGSTFAVKWDAVTERLHLLVQQGSVSVNGPVASSAVLLKGGQRLAIGARPDLDHRGARRTGAASAAGDEGTDRMGVDLEALAVVRSAGTAGTITSKTSSGGLSSDPLVVEAK